MSTRIMTYNVHGCRGTDGIVSVERIAEVIARYKPDIIALQELDVNRKRSRLKDQPKIIAESLNWKFHYYPSFNVEEGSYGNAVLSRFPIELIKTELLPWKAGGAKKFRKNSLNPLHERRGAIWISVDWEGIPLQVVITHLGLRKKERLLQLKKLIGEDWLQKACSKGPTIFCGDLNAWPRSKSYKLVAERFRDVQIGLGIRPAATFHSRMPLFRIDHIFLDRTLSCTSFDVPRGPLETKASDHLPLIADFTLDNESF